MKFAAGWALFETWGKDFFKHWRKGPGAHKRALCAYFGEMELDDINHLAVDGYRASRVGIVTAASRNREVASLVRATKFLAKREYMVAPLTSPDWERETPVPRAYIDDASLAKWLAEIPSRRVRDLLVFACWTGLRWNELAALQWSAVERDAAGWPMRVVLTEGATKTGAGRIVPLTQQAAAIVARRQDSGGAAGAPHPLVFGGVKYYVVSYQLRKARTRAGLPVTMVLHGARHTAATNLDLAGTPWPLVKAIIGHTSDRVALGYQHASRAALDAAAVKLGAR